MRAPVTLEKRRWSVAAGGAVGVILLLLWLLRLPLVVPPRPVAAGAKVSVALGTADASKGAMGEQAALQDTMPLFLPTEHNATVREVPRREPGKTFFDNDTLKLNFGDAGLNLIESMPPTATLNGKAPAEAAPQDALEPGVGGQMLTGFGRANDQVSPLPPRGGFIEVIAASTGLKVLAETLSPGDAPQTDKEWQPLEFLAAVDAAGLVGPLMLTEGSRVEEVDAYFRKFLALTYRIGARLPPGFYRVIVGP